MKKIALFLSVVIATAMADTAAAKPDTLSIDKTYYPGRRAFYELTPVKKHNIVMLGNSPRNAACGANISNRPTCSTAASAATAYRA